MFSRLTARVAAYINGRRSGSSVVRVLVDRMGITVEAGRGSRGAAPRIIPWEDVRRVTVFKRSVYAHHLLCMLIESRDGIVLEVDETVQGWKQLIDDLPRRLPSTTPLERWYPQTAFTGDESPVTIYTHRPEHFTEPGR